MEKEKDRNPQGNPAASETNMETDQTQNQFANKDNQSEEKDKIKKQASLNLDAFFLQWKIQTKFTMPILTLRV